MAKNKSSKELNNESEFDPRPSRTSEAKEAILDAFAAAFVGWAVKEITEKTPVVLNFLKKKTKETMISLKSKYAIRKLYNDTCQRAIGIGGTNMVRAINEAIDELGIREDMGKYIVDYVSTVRISVKPSSWAPYYEKSKEEIINDALSTGIDTGERNNKSYIIRNLENAEVSEKTIKSIMDTAKKYIIPAAVIISGINNGLSKV